MNKNGKITITLLGSLTILVILLTVVWLYFDYPNMQHTKADITISAEDLIRAYHGNEDVANTVYREKILEVDGIIKEVTFLNNRNTVILHGTNNYSSVLCDMASSQSEAIKNLKPDQPIKIKGVCKGFLKDAILLNCILIKTLTDE